MNFSATDVLTIVVPIVALVTWLVKSRETRRVASAIREETITDKFIAFLQSSTEKQQLISERHESALKQVSDSLHETTIRHEVALLKVSETMQGIAKEVSGWRCPAAPASQVPPKQPARGRKTGS